MVYRPAQVYNGTGWDDIGDKRIGASAGDIPQASVANLTSDLASKAANPKTVDTKTANYTLVLGDRDKIVQMNSTSARTITVPTNASVAFPVGTIVHIANINTGTLTIAGASGVTVSQAGGLTLAQWESGSLYQRAANAWVFLKGGGLGAANFSNAATGTYSDSGINYKYVTFTASGTLTVTKAGFADILVVSGGGGGGAGLGGGGGAGGYIAENVYLSAVTHTVIVGAGAAGGSNSNGSTGNASYLRYIAPPGGAGGPRGEGSQSQNGLNGGSGSGGSAENGVNRTGGSALVSGLGNGGGNANNSGLSFPNIAAGGGGGAGAVGGNSSSGTGGAGGSGSASSITGTSVTRAGGGGGGAGITGGTGSNGGGNGGGVASAGSAATANTGSGGGGGAGSNANGGAGGSGIVIVRVRT